MKLLMTTPYYYPKIGGLENYARQLAKALQAQGDELIIITSSHDATMEHRAIVDGMTIYRLPRWFKLSNTPVNPLWTFALRTIIRQEKPDVIMTHSPVPTMADATMLAAGKTPVILFYHAATLLKKDAPVFNAIARLYRLYESLTMQKATRIAAVSEYVVTSLPARFQKKAIVVPNAVWAADVITPSDRLEQTGFVFVASLDKTHSWKGLDTILEALSVHKEKYGDAPLLRVIGDGDYRSHYEQVARSLSLTDSVIFYGALSGTAKTDAIRQAKALICYPTTSNDAFPTVMLEAWSLGVVVVAAAIGPLPSLITDSVDGILVMANDSSALSEALHSVIGTSPLTTRRITTTAARRTKQMYTWETQAAYVKQIIKEIV